jgi:hypothetical protein
MRGQEGGDVYESTGPHSALAARCRSRGAPNRTRAAQTDDVLLSQVVISPVCEDGAFTDDTTAFSRRAKDRLRLRVIAQT